MNERVETIIGCLMKLSWVGATSVTLPGKLVDEVLFVLAKHGNPHEPNVATPSDIDGLTLYGVKVLRAAEPIAADHLRAPTLKQLAGE